MSMPKKFAIIKFPKENDARGIVPLLWINEEKGMCSYPIVTTNEMRDSLVKTEAPPTTDWTKHEMVILKKYATYSDARLKLRDADLTSNLDSDEEDVGLKRKRKPNRHLSYPGEFSDESDCDEPTKNLTVNNKKPAIPPYPSFDNALIENDIDQNKQVQRKSLICETSSVQSPIASPSSSQSLFSPSPHSRFALTPPICKMSQKENIKQITVSKLLEGQLQLQAMIVDLNERIITLDQKVDKVLSLIPNNSNTNEQVDMEDPECALLGLFPLTNIKDFEALEHNLNDSAALRNKLVKLFMSVGGSDIKNLSINIMRRAMTDEFAQFFSFTGKKGYKDEKKEAFASTKLFHSIQVAMRRVLKDSFVEEKTKKHITMWLNQAKTRLVRRAERRKTINAQDTGMQENGAQNRDD